MATPEEIDVMFDANTASIKNGFDYIQSEIARLQNAVRNIGKDSYKSVDDFGKALSARTKELQTALGQMRAVTGTGSFAADYNAALKEMQDRGRAFFRQQENDRKESLARQTALERDAARVFSDIDVKSEANRTESRKLASAARLEATKAEIVSNARMITSEEELSRARAKSIGDLQRYRAAARTVVDPEQQRSLQTLIQLEKARSAALEQTNNALIRQKTAADNRLAGLNTRTSLALAPGDVRDMVNTSGDAASTKVGLQFDQELARRQLLAATTAEETAAALKNLDIANARVRAVEGIVRQEQKLIDVEQALTTKDLSSQQRAQMQLSQQFAKEQISQVGIQQAMEAQKARVLEAEALLRQRLVTSTVEERQEAQRSLDVENARMRALERENNAQGVQYRQSLAGRAQTAITNTALYGVVAGAGYAAFNQAQEMINDVVHLEDEFAKLQAISGSTDTQMVGLKASIYGIGESSRFAVNDLVKVAQTLAQAGVNAKDMTDVLRSVSTLATASGSTPEESAQIVTSALGAFQLQASETGRIADLLTTALNRTKLTVQQVGQAIQYVGATAYENNISLETLLATIGAVAQGGVRSGSTIGTGFRQFLIGLQEPTAKLKFELDQLGITQAQVDVRTRGLGAVLETLKEKGFGASQAYAGLETRAASFYLVAKNNVDMMDQLQLSFAQSGAAAIANERAMNSLSAQWTRFRNILEEGFASSMQTPMNILQNLLTALSDRIIQMRQQAAELKAKQADGSAKWYEKDLEGYGVEGLRRGFNFIGNGTMVKNALYDGGTDFGKRFGSANGFGTGSGFGDWLDSWGKSAEKATTTTQLYATAIQEASAEVDTHGQRIVEVDKEMERLKTQQKDLINNTTRSQAETVTLSARFEGLSKYLGTMKNSYLDLINAMNQYRGAEQTLLAQAYGGLANKQDMQNRANSTALQTDISQIKGNSQLMGMLTPQERSALNTPDNINFPAIMRDAAKRIEKSSTVFADKLSTAGELAGELAVGRTSSDRDRQQAGQAQAGATGLGIEAADRLATFNSRMDAIRSETLGDRTKDAASLQVAVQSYLGKLQTQLPKIAQGNNREFVSDTIKTLKEILGQIASEMKPTAEELKEAKRADAEKRREEAEAHKRPFVTEGDLNDLLGSMNLTDRFRRGHDESDAARAEENNLHARGLTTATADSSDHTRKGGVARDISIRGMSDEEAKNLVTAINVRLKAEGIDGTAIFEGGGPNQGTARHIHVGIRPYTRFSKDRETDIAAQQESAALASSVTTDEDTYQAALKTLGKASTDDAFKTAVTNAEDALAKLKVDLQRKGASDLARQGIVEGTPEFAARMKDVNQQIATMTQNLQQKAAEGLVKMLEAQAKALEAAFKRATQSAQDNLAFSQGQVTGLGFFSNRNKVPDYVQALAANRVSANQESLDRVTAASLPAQISGNEALLSQARAAMEQIKAKAAANGTLPEENAGFGNVSAEIDKLTQSVADLRKQKQALDAALGAKGLVPTSISSGVTQAIQQYRQANDLTKSFKDTVIYNLGGAISQVHNGLNTMFEDIFTGSKSALGAFGEFALGIGKYLEQLAAKFVASQVLNMILGLAGSVFGSKLGSSKDIASLTDFANSTASNFSIPVSPNFNGGSLMSTADDPLYNGRGILAGMPHLLGGGEVTNGSNMQDSVYAKLAKREWVVRGEAVDSVGTQFMARLNKYGAAALDHQAGSVVPMAVAPKQQMAVYVVSPEQQPTLGKNDVLVAVHNDILQGGETKKLIKYVQQGG